MTDTQLIDWLEAQAKNSRTGISFDFVRKCEEDPAGFRFMRRFFIGEPCHDLRNAIERAMDSETKGEFQ